MDMINRFRTVMHGRMLELVPLFFAYKQFSFSLYISKWYMHVNDMHMNECYESRGVERTTAHILIHIHMHTHTHNCATGIMLRNLYWSNNARI